MTEMTYIIQCDGMSKKKGEVECGAWAFVVFDEEGKRVWRESGTKHPATFNEMEWEAVIRALDYSRKQEIVDRVTICSDSLLVVNQFNLNWKVGKRMYPYWIRSQTITDKYGDMKVEKVSRDKTKHADALCSANWNITYG